jgi:hypothetical protein
MKETIMTNHAGTHLPRTLNRGRKTPPATTSGGFHGGSGRPKGVVHAAPTLPQVNAANYGAQKVKRK